MTAKAATSGPEIPAAPVQDAEPGSPAKGMFSGLGWRLIRAGDAPTASRVCYEITDPRPEGTRFLTVAARNPVLSRDRVPSGRGAVRGVIS
jgi:hypothetical protein